MQFQAIGFFLTRPDAVDYRSAAAAARPRSTVPLRCFVVFECLVAIVFAFEPMQQNMNSFDPR
jgi:hypothetical protein